MIQTTTQSHQPALVRAAPLICSRENCTRKVKARGMCESHYNIFWSKLKRKGSSLTKMTDSWDLIKDNLPGSKSQIAKRAGLNLSTVVEYINEHHQAGDCHIKKHLEPTTAGSRWVPVYALGPGKDDVVSAKRKANFALKKRRIQHAEKAAALAAPAQEQAPYVPKTVWNLAFFNPAKAMA